MGLKKQTFDGIKWQMGGVILQKIISFATTIILARYLGPSVFGLFALTLTIIASFELFKSMGIDTALIRRQDDFARAANTAFIIIPIIGVVLYLILNFAAPSIGRLINNIEVIPVLRILGISFVIACFAKVPAILLEKNMQFKQVSIIEFISSILFSITALIFVFLNFGIWSLVYAYIIKIFTNMLMVCLCAKWKPKFEFDRKLFLEMFNFGKFILLSAIVWFLKMNLDNLLVGKLLGVTALGLYAVAFNIANFGADYFGSKVYRVTYPAYSKLQNSLDDLKSAYLKVLKHVSLIAIPLGIGIFLLGEDFLRIAYGEKWIGAANVLKILAIAGIFNTFPSSISGVFLACGKPKFGFWANSLQVAIFLILITPMSKTFGLNGVGIVVSLSSFIAFILMLIWGMKLLSLTFHQVFIHLKPALFASFLMALGIIILKYILLQYKFGITFYYNFALTLFLSLVIYLFSIFKIEKILFIEMKELLLSKSQKSL